MSLEDEIATLRRCIEWSDHQVNLGIQYAPRENASLRSILARLEGMAAPGETHLAGQRVIDEAGKWMVSHPSNPNLAPDLWRALVDHAECLDPPAQSAEDAERKLDRPQSRPTSGSAPRG